MNNDRPKLGREIALSRKSAAAFLAIAIVLGSAPESRAQGFGVTSPPPEEYTIAPGGVDMRTGRYVYRETDLVASGGESTGELSLTRTEDFALPGHKPPFANMSHNWNIMLTERRGNLLSVGPVSGLSDYQVYVTQNGRTETFSAMSLTTAFSQTSRSPMSSVTHTGTRGAGGEVYTYSAPDGTAITFRPLALAGAADCSETLRCAYASEIVSPDGTKTTLQYETRTTGNRARLKSVTSNRGFAILFEYANPDWNLITKSCLYNLSLTLEGSGGTCSSGAVATASYSYTSHGGKPKLSAVQDSGGQSWLFGYSTGTIGSQSFEKVSYQKPGAASPWLVNWNAPHKNNFDIDEDVTWKQDFADGSGYSYQFDFTPTQVGLPAGSPQNLLAGGAYTDASGKTTEVRFDFPEVPWSLEVRDIGTGAGQILSYLLQPGRTLVVKPDANQDYTIDEMRADERDAFQEMLYGAQLAALAHCNECSGAAAYRFHTAYQITPGPTKIVDAEGGKSTYDYCDRTAIFTSLEPYTCMTASSLQSWTDEEGIKTEYKYNANRMIEARRKAKPGSGLADIVESASYANVTCATAKYCNKPLTVTDANNNVTSYTYDSAHGGLLTETGPAVNGIAPQTRHEYEQRYAWIKNSGGTWSQAATPVWVKIRQEFCKTSAASAGNCAGGAADEVVTTYEYEEGSASKGSNLLLKGIAVTADGQTLRTCYKYDERGRKISETEPKGTVGLTVCP